MQYLPRISQYFIDDTDTPDTEIAPQGLISNLLKWLH